MKLVISKKQIWYALIFLSIWILVGFNTGNADSSQYIAMFKSATQGNFYYAEKGFLFLCMLFGKAGFDYQFFLAAYSLVALALITSFIKRNTDHPALALLLYAIFPFFFDAVQIRNLMVEALFLFALRYLREFSVKNAVKYIILILVASTQHTIALVYLVFLIVYIKDNKKIVCLSVGGSFLFIVLYRFYLGTIIKTFTSNRVNYAFNDTSTPSSTVVKYSLYFGTILALGCFVYWRRIKSYNGEQIRMNIDDRKERELVEFLERIMLVSMCLIPFIFADANYTRLFRNCMLMFYCLILNKKVYKGYKDYQIISSLTVGYSLVGWFMNFAPGIYYYDTITYPILHNNIIFEWLKL